MIQFDPEPVSDQLLRCAIELKMDDCFPAMNIANALGGSPSAEWKLVRKYSLPALVEEALDRGLRVHEFRSAVEKKAFVACRCYASVRQEVGGRADFPV